MEFALWNMFRLLVCRLVELGDEPVRVLYSNIIKLIHALMTTYFRIALYPKEVLGYEITAGTIPIHGDQ